MKALAFVVDTCDLAYVFPSLTSSWRFNRRLPLARRPRRCRSRNGSIWRWKTKAFKLLTNQPTLNLLNKPTKPNTHQTNPKPTNQTNQTHYQPTLNHNHKLPTLSDVMKIDVTSWTKFRPLLWSEAYRSEVYRSLVKRPKLSEAKSTEANRIILNTEAKQSFYYLAEPFLLDRSVPILSIEA